MDMQGVDSGVQSSKCAYVVHSDLLIFKFSRQFKVQLESTFANFLTDLYTGRKKFGKLQKSSSPTTLRRRPQETLSRRART